MKVPEYDGSNGKIPAIERCLRNILTYLSKNQIRGDGKTVAVSDVGGGIVISAKPQVHSSVASQPTNLTVEYPEVYANYCGIFPSGVITRTMPTMVSMNGTTDDKVYVGIGPQIVNINGVVEQFQYQAFEPEADDVGSRSFYDPYYALGEYSNVRDIVGIWKPSDLILNSNPSGGIDEDLTRLGATGDVKNATFILRLKCTLKAVQQPDSVSLMPFCFVWEVRPSMMLEGFASVSYNYHYRGAGWSQYFKGNVPNERDQVMSWYIPLGKVMMTNCSVFIKDLIEEGVSESTFNILVQTTNTAPSLTISLTNAQISKLLEINQAVNNA